MNDPNPREPLASQLRAAAGDAPLAFSPPLHARVMRAVEASRRVSVSGAYSGSHRWMMRIAALVLIGVTLAGAMLWMSRGNDPVAKAPPAPPARLSPDVLAQALERGEALPTQLARSLNDSRLAYLDEDGRQLARFMLSTLPQLPRDAAQSGS